MLFNENAQRRVRFASFVRRGRFSELPAVDAQAKWPSNNDGFYTSGNDGLRSSMIPDFYGRYARAREVSARLAAIASEPEARGAISLEAQLSALFKRGMEDASWGFEWGAAFERSKVRWTTLRSGLAQASLALERYITELPAAIDVAVNARDARVILERAAAAQAAEQERIRAAGETAKAAAAAAQAAAESAAAQASAEVQAAQSQLVTAQTQREAGTTAVEVAKLQQQASIAGSPKIAGMTYPTAGLLAGALALGAWWFSKHEGKRR